MIDSVISIVTLLTGKQPFKKTWLVSFSLGAFGILQGVDIGLIFRVLLLMILLRNFGLASTTLAGTSAEKQRNSDQDCENDTHKVQI